MSFFATLSVLILIILIQPIFNFFYSKLRVIFDGTTVINRDIDTYPSKVNEVTIGKNLLGGSSCEPNFAGKILSVERLSPNWDPRQQ